MTATITREKYDAGVEAAGRLGISRCHPCPERLATQVVAAFVAAVGIEVERTPEGRIAAFVAEVRTKHWSDTASAADILVDMILRHFPEVRRIPGSGETE